MPPMNSTGNEHGDQRHRHRDDGEADLAQPLIAACIGVSPHFDVADDVSRA